MTQPKINIAIDGFSSTGKSTLAKQLAKKLGYKYLDTGAMYRAVTLFALKHHFIDDHYQINEADLISSINQGKIEVRFAVNQEGQSETLLNGENVEKAIRQMEVSSHVSGVASISDVRRFLVKQQQKMAESKGVVMDGRDIGTVVLPEAELKVFVTAKQGVRTQRRFEELLSKGEKITKQEVEANLVQRDLQDTTREDSPLVEAEDSILLDNSELTRDEQLEKVLSWVAERQS